MVVNRKVTGTAKSMPGGLALGWGISLAVTLLGAMLFAALISREMIRAEAIGYCSMGILLVASMLGAAVAIGAVKRRRAYVCGLSGLIYYGTLLGMTALFFGGQYQGMGVTALLVAAGCGAVLLMGLRGEKRSNTRRRKNVHH